LHQRLVPQVSEFTLELAAAAGITVAQDVMLST